MYRDPAAQYHSCVRRYRVGAWQMSVPHWNHLEAVIAQLADNVCIQLENPDWGKVCDFTGVPRHRIALINPEPVNMLGDTPSPPAYDYPDDLHPYRIALGYAQETGGDSEIED